MGFGRTWNFFVVEGDGCFGRDKCFLEFGFNGPLGLKFGL